MPAPCQQGTKLPTPQFWKPGLTSFSHQESPGTHLALINTALVFLLHSHLLFPICCLNLPLNCELFGVATISYFIYPAKHGRVPPHDCSYKGATILQINIKKRSHCFSLPKGSTGFAFPHWVLSSQLFLIIKLKTTTTNPQKQNPNKTPHNASSFSCRIQCEELKVSQGYVSGLLGFFHPKALSERRVTIHDD